MVVNPRIVTAVKVLVLLNIFLLMATLYFFVKYLLLQKQAKSVIQQTVVNTNSKQPLDTDPTANWRLYEDSSSGYSFKYPDDYFTFKQNDLQNVFFVATSAPNGGNGPKFLGNEDVWLSTETWENSSWQSVEQFISNQEKDWQSLIISSVLIGDLDGKKLEYTYPTIAAGSSTTPIYVLEGVVLKRESAVLKSGKIYSVTLSSFSQEKTKSNDARFDQILSTFTFIQ